MLKYPGYISKYQTVGFVFVILEYEVQKSKKYCNERYVIIAHPNILPYKNIVEPSNIRLSEVIINPQVIGSITNIVMYLFGSGASSSILSSLRFR